MFRPMNLLLCLVVLGVANGAQAEIYRVFPRSIDAYVGSSSGPFLGIGNDNYTAQYSQVPLSAVGPMLYDANLNTSGNGSIKVNKIELKQTSSPRQFFTGDLGLYPYTDHRFSGLKIRINPTGTLSVSGGLVTGLTATIYEGTYSSGTYYSRTDSSALGYDFDFGLNPATLSISAFVTNGPWNLPYNNPSLFFDEDPFDNPPGITGSNPNDTESAGIRFFGMSGNIFGRERIYNSGGFLVSDVNRFVADPFYMQVAATVPEAGTMTLVAVAGGLGLVGLGARRLRSRSSV